MGGDRERKTKKKEEKRELTEGGREESRLAGRETGRVREGDSEFLLLKLVAKNNSTSHWQFY